MASLHWRILRWLAVVALVVVAFLGGCVVGGRDDEDSTDHVTDAEHDRLVDSCVAEVNNPSGCAAWIAGVVEAADEEGLSYVDLSQMLADEYARDRRGDRELQDLCDFLSRTSTTTTDTEC